MLDNSNNLWRAKLTILEREPFLKVVVMVSRALNLQAFSGEKAPHILISGPLGFGKSLIADGLVQTIEKCTNPYRLPRSGNMLFEEFAGQASRDFRSKIIESENDAKILVSFTSNHEYEIAGSDIAETEVFSEELQNQANGGLIIVSVSQDNKKNYGVAAIEFELSEMPLDERDDLSLRGWFYPKVLTIKINDDIFKTDKMAHAMENLRQSEVYRYARLTGQSLG